MKDSPHPSPLSPPGSSLPLHVQVSEMLARDIRAGLLVDGAKLAPERDMAAGLGIAVGTLRKALADLAEKGLLERIQGSGNYVRNDGTAKTLYGFFHLERIGGGGLPTAQGLMVESKAKPDDLPAFGQADDALLVRRLRYLGGVAAALEEIWLDGTWLGETVPKTLPESLYAYYRDHLNLWISRADDAVSVAPVPEWRPQGFGSDDAIWGYVERFGYDQHNERAEYSRTWFDPQTTRFVARWT